MKKICICLFTLTCMFCLLSFPIAAVTVTDYENIVEEIELELETAIDGEVKDILKEIGIDGFSFDDIYNVSFDSISSFFADTLKDKLSDCIKKFSELLGVLLLTGILSVVFSDSTNADFIGIIAATAVSLLAVDTASVTLSAVISVLELSGKFMLSYIPIYTLIISLSGNPAAALTYNTLIIGFAEIISSFITGGITDFLGIYFCLGISFSFNSSINLNRIIIAVNKIFNTVLGFASSIFTGFLSLKSVLAAATDSLSVKGIKFMIGSLIPVVGSSISDAYSTFLGSINLIKSSVAIIGIIVITVINIPIIFEALTYYISFNILSHIAETASASKCSEILKCFACGIRMLLLVCIFEMFILIISTGILLSVKNGG